MLSISLVGVLVVLCVVTATVWEVVVGTKCVIGLPVTQRGRPECGHHGWGMGYGSSRYWNMLNDARLQY